MNRNTQSTDGFFNEYGGKYVAEVLRRPLDELEAAFHEAMQDKAFLDELDVIRRDYIGRETPLYFAPTATKLLGGAQIYIKLEGLANTGAQNQQRHRPVPSCKAHGKKAHHRRNGRGSARTCHCRRMRKTRIGLYHIYGRS